MLLIWKEQEHIRPFYPHADHQHKLITVHRVKNFMKYTFTCC